MTSASDMLLSIFDRIYIINLAHRDDRRREMATELGRIGLRLDHPAVALFPASFPPDQGRFPSRGARGCFESHLAVHGDIVSRGLSHALVLEDDAQLVPDFGARLAAFGPHLAQRGWDQFYSVTPLVAERGDTDLGAGLVELAPGHRFKTTHFVGFSQQYSRRAVDYLQTMHDRQGGDPRGGPMHVDGAYGWLRRDNPDLRVLASREPLAVQRSSRSDIAQLKLWDRLPVLRTLASAARRLKG